MKKQLTMTTAMAAALIALPACSSTGNGWEEEVVADADTAICVNEAGERVDDDLCDDDFGSRRSYGFAHYYIGRGRPLPYYGDSIQHRRFAGAGSFNMDPTRTYGRAPAATRMTRSAAVSRGGLGSSGRSFGGGRS
jgi:hypothetical protein